MNTDKYILIMADYCADACWDRNGCADDLDEYPLAVGTKARLREWQWFYDYFGDDYKDKDEQKFPDEMFAKWGLRLAKQVKVELPEFTVEYNGGCGSGYSRQVIELIGEANE